MNKRVTIVIDEATDREVRMYQAKIIMKTGVSYSYSSAIRVILKRGLK